MITITTKTIKMTTTLPCGCSSSISISYTLKTSKSPEKFPQKIGELCSL